MKKYLASTAILCLFGSYFIYTTDTPFTATAQASPHGANTTTAFVPNHAVILLYHHVALETPTITSISPDNFAKQLEYLAQNNFQVWPLEKIIKHLQSKEAMPDKVVGISFDDGYESIYDHAFPLLKKYQYPFTIFVSTDAVDQQFKYQASWQQLRTMASNGATIANHSATHQHMLVKDENISDKQWLQQIQQDIEHAEQRIKEEIGYSKKLFAYPYGEYNQQLIKLIKRLGYTAFGQHSGPVGEHLGFATIPRYPFAGEYSDLDDFALKLMTIPLPIKKVVSDDNPLAISNSKPGLTLSFHPEFNQQASLQCFGSLQGKINVEWLDKQLVKITPKNDIPTGRSRYNCTAKFNSGDNENRYYWYSKPWVKWGEDNSWLAE